MARPSYKGPYFSPRVVKLLRGRALIESWRRLVRLERAATLPNALGGLAPTITGGARPLTLLTNRLASMRKVGEFSFTRKPFVYPYKKRKRIK